ncbi:MAG: Flagellar basal body rod modification protein [Bacteroidetes bacterium]|nr:Flagellar basal body rod modification protein [Bacteroidota bacterium]
MKLQHLVLTSLLVACTYAASAINTYTSSKNDAVDNVPGIAMDASGNTYVLENLYAGSNSVGIGGNVGVATVPYDEHASVIVEKISSSGTYSLIGRIDILNTSSFVTGTAITLAADGKLYVTGYFSGNVKPTGPMSSKSANDIDMFVCSISPAGGGWSNWNQSGGDGEEYATCLNVIGTDIYVGGYYGQSYSTGLSSTFPVTSGTVTAPALTYAGDRNSFIARFTTAAGLPCQEANGWMSLGGGEVEISGIASTLFLGTRTSYITGRIKGGSSTPAISPTTGYSMFIARFTHNTNTWNWAKLEGTFYPNHLNDPVCSGKAIIVAPDGYLYIAGAAAYSSPTPTGYQGLADAVYLKINTIGTVINRELLGGTDNDAANAIAYDGTNMVIGGNFKPGSGTITLNNNGGSASTFTTTAAAMSFMAQYNTSGGLQWYERGESTVAAGTAVASDLHCNVALGGNFYNTLVWDPYIQNSWPSGTSDHLYVNLMSVKKLTLTPAVAFTPVPTLENGFSYNGTVSGATSYTWISLATPPLNVTVTNPTTATASINLLGGGYGGSYFDWVILGNYTVSGTACMTGLERRFRQTHAKTDLTPDGIEANDVKAFKVTTYPNPAQQQLGLMVSGEALTTLDIMLFNSIGQQVMNKTVSKTSADDESYQVDISGLASGTYIYQVKNTKTGEEAKGNFVKAK